MTQAPLVPSSDPLTERIERLLARHEDSQRQVASLGAQVNLLTQERDALQERLTQASFKLDAVMDRLPQLINLDLDLEEGDV
jgi:chromosome segregation ATPase